MLAHTARASLALLLSSLPLLLAGAATAAPAPYELSPEQIDTFRRNGVLVVRGLLRGKELDDAIRAARRVQRTRSVPERIMYRLFPSYQSLQFQTWRRHRALEAVAFDSAAPSICAGLMGLCHGAEKGRDEEGRKAGRGRSVRLLKDAVLGFRSGDAGCGWHVDDKVFWPCEDRDVGERDAGVNVWITLSPVTAEEGGGLAIAPGTHRASFAAEARKAIASGGIMTTCALETLSPECHSRMEALKSVPDLEPGDAILHDRYVFHRAEPFADPVRGKKAGAKLRISLRYVPSDSTLYDNGRERAMEEKGLLTGDEVSRGGKYYPQVWPMSLPEERGQRLSDERPIWTWKRTARVLMTRTMKTIRSQ